MSKEAMGCTAFISSAYSVSLLLAGVHLGLLWSNKTCSDG
jgi:hypothetical protein